MFEPDLLEHQQNGGLWYSTWRAVGITLPLVLVPLALIFLAMAFLPVEPAAPPGGEFLWAVAYHDTPKMQVRGQVSWDSLRAELLKYPWLEEIGQPGRVDNRRLGISVCNLRLRKFLTVEIIGTPERYAYIPVVMNAFRYCECERVFFR